MNKKMIFISAMTVFLGIFLSVAIVLFNPTNGYSYAAFSKAPLELEHADEEGHEGHEHSDVDVHADEEEHEGHEHSDVDVHSDEDGHEESDSHAGEDDHEEHAIRFSTATLEEFNIKTAIASPGMLTKHIEVSGEVVINPDSVSHIIPRIPGVVKEVHKSLGAAVAKNELLAVLESRELATLKSSYLATLERYKLAQTNFNREKALWEKKISAEQDYLSSKQTLAEARINVTAAEQQLHAVGFSEEAIKQIPTQPDDLLTRYEIRAPFEGQVIEKHLTHGEFVKDETSVFTIADLKKVWVNFTLYQANLSSVRNGQTAEIFFNFGDFQTKGTISYISAVLDTHTRTATARVVVDNPTGVLRPGSFVNGLIAADTFPVSVYVPKTAIQTIENKPAVFVQHEDLFEPQFVEIGRTNKVGVEIVSGLKPGQVYVSEGGFALKAEMEKEAFASGGHSH
ncbi:MAG: efflux RND transporter periplasmic adaptor subunit [Candidatus Hinthialibacter antarcticus]|nr:efflux RND transporter periplasmic adaptor subunit [Candidatus Hinthialibacter antarcticus]